MTAEEIKGEEKFDLQKFYINRGIRGDDELEVLDDSRVYRNYQDLNQKLKPKKQDYFREKQIDRSCERIVLNRRAIL